MFYTKSHMSEEMLAKIIESIKSKYKDDLPRKRQLITAVKEAQALGEHFPGNGPELVLEVLEYVSDGKTTLETKLTALVLDLAAALQGLIRNVDNIMTYIIGSGQKIQTPTQENKPEMQEKH